MEEDPQRPRLRNLANIQARQRWWLVTFHNESYNAQRVFARANGRIIGMSGQCEWNGDRRHWHIAVRFRDPLRYREVQRMLATENARCDAVRYPEEAVKYATKPRARIPGTLFQCGDLGPAAKKTGPVWDHMLEMIKRAEPMEVMLDEAPATLIRHAKNVEYLRGIAQTKRGQVMRTDLRVTWVWGPTGTGKTRYCFWTLQQWLSDNGREGQFPWVKSNPATKWMEGYDGQEACGLDDVSPTAKPEFSLMLRLLDLYPLQVEDKGVHRPWMAKRIIVTSNYHPRDLYPELQWTWDTSPLKRRIHEIIHMENSWTPPESPVLETEERLSPIGGDINIFCVEHRVMTRYCGHLQHADANINQQDFRPVLERQDACTDFGELFGGVLAPHYEVPEESTEEEEEETEVIEFPPFKRFLDEEAEASSTDSYVDPTPPPPKRRLRKKKNQI